MVLSSARSCRRPLPVRTSKNSTRCSPAWSTAWSRCRFVCELCSTSQACLLQSSMMDAFEAATTQGFPSVCLLLPDKKDESLYVLVRCLGPHCGCRVSLARVLVPSRFIADTTHLVCILW